MKTQSSALGTGETVLQIVAVELKTLGCPVTQFDEHAKERLEACEFRHLKPVITGGLSAVPPDKSGSHSFRLKLGPGANQTRSFELYRVGGSKPGSVDLGSTTLIAEPSDSRIYEIIAGSGDHGKRFEWLFKCRLSGGQFTDLPTEKDSASPSEAEVQPDPPNGATILSSVGNPITTPTTATGDTNEPKAQPNGRNDDSMAEHKLVRWLAEKFCGKFGTTIEAVQSGAKAEEATCVRRATVLVARGLGVKPRDIATVKGISRAGNTSLMLSKAQAAYGTGVSDFANHVKAVKAVIPKDLRPNGNEGAAVETGAFGLATPTPEKPKRRPYTRRATKVGIANLFKAAREDHSNGTIKPGRDLLIFLIGQSDDVTTTDLMKMFDVSEAEVERAFGHFALAARRENSKIPALMALFKEVAGQT